PLVLQRLAVGVRHHGVGDLVAGAVLVVLQGGVHLLVDPGGDDSGGVDDGRREGRELGGGDEEEGGGRSPHRGMVLVVGLLPRSTVGALRAWVLAANSGRLWNPNTPAARLRGKCWMLTL